MSKGSKLRTLTKIAEFRNSKLFFYYLSQQKISSKLM